MREKRQERQNSCSNTRFLFLGRLTDAMYFFQAKKDVKIKPFHVRLSYLIISLAAAACHASPCPGTRCVCVRRSERESWMERQSERQ